MVGRVRATREASEEEREGGGRRRVLGAESYTQRQQVLSPKEALVWGHSRNRDKVGVWGTRLGPW